MKTPLLLFSALGLPFLLAGCAIFDDNDSSATPEGSNVVVVQEGQRIVLAAYDATLTFVEKTEDSRCPTNVTCVWEGQAKILLEVARSGQEPASFEMVGFVGPDGNDPSREPGVTHEAFGLRFTLERVDPYPIDGVEQTDPATATMRVKRL